MLAAIIILPYSTFELEIHIPSSDFHVNVNLSIVGFNLEGIEDEEVPASQQRTLRC